MIKIVHFCSCFLFLLTTLVNIDGLNCDVDRPSCVVVAPPVNRFDSNHWFHSKSALLLLILIFFNDLNIS